MRWMSEMDVVLHDAQRLADTEIAGWRSCFYSTWLAERCSAADGVIRLEAGSQQLGARANLRLICAFTFYCALTQVSEPASLTATSVKKIRSGLPSPVPRWSKATRRGPAFL